MNRLIPYIACLLLLIPARAQQRKTYVLQPGDYSRGDTIFNVRGQVIRINRAPAPAVSGHTPTGAGNAGRIVQDTLILPDFGVRFVKGKAVALNIGTMPDGRFRYIGKKAAQGQGARLGAQWAHSAFRITGFHQSGAAASGQAYYLDLKGPNSQAYECDLIPALRSGEVLVPGYERPLLPGSNRAGNPQKP